MAGHITMTLATARDDQPRAATVFYANDGFDLYFISDPDSVHSQDLLANQAYQLCPEDEPKPDGKKGKPRKDEEEKDRPPSAEQRAFVRATPGVHW